MLVRLVGMRGDVCVVLGFKAPHLSYYYMYWDLHCFMQYGGVQFVMRLRGDGGGQALLSTAWQHQLWQRTGGIPLLAELSQFCLLRPPP